MPLNHPDIVSIAWILTNEKGVVLSKEYHIVKPQGWTIPDDSVAIHHITFDLASKYGVDLGSVMTGFVRDASVADVIVAHNIRFDQNVVNNALKWRLHSGLTLEGLGKRMFCTMQNGRKIVGLPGKTPNTFKYPKLSEMHNQLFGTIPDNLHSSEKDTEVLMKCFFRVWGNPLDLPEENPVQPNEARVATKLVLSLAETS
jgi:DNA polymerase III epsilon subunit-like protein